MTSSESVSSILVSCRQTRFHIENPNYRELDIEGLNITVTSSPDRPKTARGKGKAKGAPVLTTTTTTTTNASQATEILTSARLRLKAGRRYALLGRNGTGKSTLLRAVAEKLIPGIPEETRIAILQQTDVRGWREAEADLHAGSNEDPVSSSSASSTSSLASSGRTVLEEVIGTATSKDELEREIAVLSEGVNGAAGGGGGGIKAVRALRRVRHERMQKRLFVLDKMARLRSGARGAAARRELVAFEKEVAESMELCGQKDEDISPTAVEAEAQEAADMLAGLRLQLEPARLSGVESRAKKILAGLGFPGAQTERRVAELSGGWRMRAALAAALLQEADILILDEPTNFLDLLGILWLQRYLEHLGDSPEAAPTLLLVSHDRDFISACTTDLLIIKDQDLTYFHGDLPTYEASTSERRQYLARMKEAKERQKAHIQATIAGNMREGKKRGDGNRVRQAKQRQKKLDDRWGLEVSAKGGRFRLNRDLGGYHLTSRADIEVPPEDRPPRIVLPEPSGLRFPAPLMSLEGVTFRYPPQAARGGDKGPAATPAPAVLQDVTLSVGMGDRIGILGLNGSGKSTLVRLLAQEEEPARGTAAAHPRLKLGYYSQSAVGDLQHLGAAEPELTALALLTREVAGQLAEGEVRGLLGSLGLPGRLASDVRLGRLSGGQLVRCGLARILWRRPHCLVLDEVTTHLDYETTKALRAALRGWEGAVVLVSHDRWCMRGVVEGMVDEDEEDDADAGDDYDDGNTGGGGGSKGRKKGKKEEEEEETTAGAAVIVAGRKGEGSSSSSSRRRRVYRIKGGVLSRLEGGVQQFEDVMEKTVNKLFVAG